MPSYRENFVRLLYTIILAQFAVIAILLGGLSNDYLSNAYQQAWVAKNAPLLAFLLHGEIDALFIGVALGGTILLIQRRMGGGKTEQAIGPTSIKPSAPTYIPAPPVQAQTLQDPLVPNSAPQSRKKDPTQEKPEDILAEIERHDV